jgi:glycosyltransferase involved in cell wall biosynthesis
MTARVLLTVSGVIPPDLHEQLAAGRRPRPDYLAMAEAFGADLLDHAEARRTAGRFGRILARVGGANALLAWQCFRRRHRYELIFTDGEQIGLPLAALLRLARTRPQHFMIVHILSVPKKVRLFRALRLGGRIDRMFLYAGAQVRFVTEQLGYPADRSVLTPFMVDTTFFTPVEVSRSERPVVCSAGLEFRDYPTMVEAVRGLDARVVLAAASPWSARRDTSADVALPDNVEVRRLPLDELRQLYAEADVVVVPLVETDFQAGITTILEAMAMGKPIVCTLTSGQDDTIIEGETGLYVPPGDAGAMRAAIDRLLDDPELAARLGEAARRWCVEHAEVEVYSARLTQQVAAALGPVPLR